MIRLVWALALVSAIGCGGSGSNGGGGGGGNGGGGSAGSGGGGGGSGAVCTGNAGVSAACIMCQTTSCDSQEAACLGPDYKNHNFSGPCAAFARCTCACAANDFACYSGCQSQYSSACMSCSMQLDVCVRQSCSSVCGGGGSPDMATATGGNCAALAACCPQLPANQQSGCNGVVGGNNDAACGYALGNYRSAGQCK